MRIRKTEWHYLRALILIAALSAGCGGQGSAGNTDARTDVHNALDADAGAEATAGTDGAADAVGDARVAIGDVRTDASAHTDSAIGSHVDAGGDARPDKPADAPADAASDVSADAAADTRTVVDADRRDGKTSPDADAPRDAATAPDSEPFILQAYQQCGRDGHVHWYDSRGAMGARVQTCDECGRCRNSSATEAACDVVEKDFTPCRLVTDPDRSYDICIRGVCRSPGCGTSDCNVPSPHFPLADTNQRRCYDDKLEIDCPSAGEPFFGQDAQSGWDTINESTGRFTRDNTGGTTYPMVVDNVTGLIWQGCAAGLAGADCEVDENPYPAGASVFNYRQALAYCEDLVWRGRTDWRLPDPYELYSILDFGRGQPFIDTDAFPRTPMTGFWSSSSSEDNPSLSWDISFNQRDTSASYKDQERRVRCVRGGAFLPRSFQVSVLSGDRVVSDNVTGLMWQGCPAGLTGDDCTGGSAMKYTWRDALAYCEGLVWGDHQDWRLANIKELQGIVDLNRDPAIDLVAFPETPGIPFWTSATDVDDTAVAIEVHFRHGNVVEVGKDMLRNTRCVR